MVVGWSKQEAALGGRGDASSERAGQCHLKDFPVVATGFQAPCQETGLTGGDIFWILRDKKGTKPFWNYSKSENFAHKTGSIPITNHSMFMH